MKSSHATTKTAAPILPRSEYGALNSSQALSPEQQLQLKDLIDKAVKSGAVPKAYISGDKRHFECMNHDVFDVLIFRGKVKGMVIQARSFWKDLRKGYTRGQKTYFLVMRSGKNVEVTELESKTCVKRAKNTTVLGQLVNHYLGKKTVACKSPEVCVSTGYKVLAKDDDGRLVSAFDDSEYKIETWRVESAKADHGGGFYFYANKELAIDATRRGDTFTTCVTEGKTLVLCEIEYAGKQIAYSGGKWAASRLRVMGELEAVELDGEE
ncbi:MAG: hypothetical protein ABI606_09360 [Rhodoferax sp.]